MRGIIADCVFSGDKNSLSLFGGIDPFRLRQYLLYWDKIDYPSNNIIYNELTPDEKYLENIGILQRTHVNFYSNAPIKINPEIFINGQLYALEKNNKNEDEMWSIGQNCPTLILPEDKCRMENTLQVKLYNCIPVPAENTSLDDILDFKEERRDELIVLRKSMDRMYDTIVKSETPELQKRRCIEELQNRVIDINRVMDESCIKRFLSSLTVELNVSDLANTAVKTFTGYSLGEKVGFPEIGAALGLASSAISIKKSVSKKATGLPDDLKDYAYLFHAKKELL